MNCEVNNCVSIEFPPDVRMTRTLWPPYCEPLASCIATTRRATERAISVPFDGCAIFRLKCRCVLSLLTSPYATFKTTLHLLVYLAQNTFRQFCLTCCWKGTGRLQVSIQTHPHTTFVLEVLKYCKVHIT